MKKRITFLTLCGMLFALCLPADAQQPAKVPRIGFLDNSTASSIAVFLEAFRQELRKLGWIEGKSCTRYHSQANEYTVSMEGFTLREASAPEAIRVERAPAQ